MFHRDGPTFWELAEQALTSTERGYDLLAKKFDYTPFRTPQPLLDVTRDELLALGGQVEAGIDLCCGTGAGLVALHPVCRERLVGVDFSREMLSQAAVNLEAQGIAVGGQEPAVELVRRNVLELDYEGEFDVATCFGALGHIQRHQELPFLRGVHRLLKPGGHFAFVTARMPSPLHPVRWIAEGYNFGTRVRNRLIKPQFHMYYLRFVLPEVQQQLESVGFDVLVRECVYPMPFTRAVLVIATRV